MMAEPRACSPEPDIPVSARRVPVAAVSETVGTPAPASLTEAHSHLATAADILDSWHAGHTGPGHTYVKDRHEAIRLIDATTRELHQVRSVLVGEIRGDQDERAARTDRLLAELRAQRPGGGSGRSHRGRPESDGGAG